MVSGETEDTYDVFLSFRGDTRFGFTKNLHEALVEKKVNAFMDVANLEKGEEISDALLSAIERSKIAIVVFSRDYASSTWCLSELVKIIECKDHRGQKVIPVFYHVEPTIIRKQTDSYGVALDAHEKKFNEDIARVHRWRSALSRAASISGWDTINRYESDLIKEIVNDVSKKLEDLRLKNSGSTSQAATSRRHVVDCDVKKKPVSHVEKVVPFDWSALAAATAAQALSKMDGSAHKVGLKGKRLVSQVDKGTVNNNWNDVAANVAASASSKWGSGNGKGF